MLRSIVTSSALLLAAACYHGPSLSTFEPALGPHGIGAELHLRGTTVEGELLETQDTALIVLTDSVRVVLVPIASIRYGNFAQRGTLIPDGYVTKRVLAELRSFSRFPGGMTPDMRRRLLAAYGQTDVQVAR